MEVGGWMLDVGCSTPPGRSPPMKSWRWNGKKFVDSKSVPLTDRGFRYGMSLLESFKVINGQPEFFEKHLMRLLSACAELEIEVLGAVRHVGRRRGRCGNKQESEDQRVCVHA